MRHVGVLFGMAMLLPKSMAVPSARAQQRVEVFVDGADGALSLIF